jgi:WD domain, G-beta repeat
LLVLALAAGVIAVRANGHAQSLARDGDAKPGKGLVAGLARTTHASTTLSGNTDQVHAVALDASGRLVASAGADGTVRLWDAAMVHRLALRWWGTMTCGELVGAPRHRHALGGRSRTCATPLRESSRLAPGSMRRRG